MIGKIIKIANAFGIVGKTLMLYVLSIVVWRSEKKVLFIPQHPNIGGTRTYFYQILDFFKKNKFTIVLLLHKDDMSEEIVRHQSTYKYRIIEYDKELKHLELWYELKHSLGRYFILDFLQQLSFLLKQTISYRISHVFVSSAYPTDLFPALYVSRKIIYAVHSMPWGEIDIGNRFFLHRILSKTKKITTVSEFAKQLIVKHWMLEGREHFVEVVHNYAPVPNLHFKKKNDGRTCILTMGNIIRDKNPILWIDIAKSITSKYGNEKVEFIWAGKGELYHQCIELTKGYENIRFVGFVETKEQLFQQADIYIQPSKRESFGLAVVEAMSYSLPCIVTEYGGTREIVIERKNGFLVEINKINLEEKIEILLKNHKLRTQFAKESENIFKEKFTEEQWEKKMKVLFTFF